MASCFFFYMRKQEFKILAAQFRSFFVINDIDYLVTMECRFCKGKCQKSGLSQ